MAALLEKFNKPQGFEFGTFQNARGMRVRYGQAPAKTEKSKGSLIIGPGFGETIEKYYELISELTAAGYDTYIMDWVGQGGSERMDRNEPQKPYDVKDFMTHHSDDLHQFATRIIQLPNDHKLGFIGNSMGGHIGLRLAERYGYIFDNISLNAPFFEINLRGWPGSFATALAASKKMLGHGRRFVPGGGEWGLRADFNRNSKTSDRQRFDNMNHIYKAQAALRAGDATVNWVLNSRSSLAMLRDPGYLKNIQTPVQMAVAGQDKTVCTKAQKKALKNLPNAIGLEYGNAMHEIWVERDEIRQPWLRNMLKLINISFDAPVKPVRISRKFPILTRKQFKR